ncbi:MAG: hypothetical protein SGCHY_001359 [Lobulomycetales sp.]
MGQDISQMYLRTDRFQRIYSLSAPTLGFNIQTIAHKKYKLNIWDVGGQKSIRGYWRNYYEKTDGLIFVIDSADREDRLLDCKAELDALLQEERLAGASLLILANKQDLPAALPLEQISERLQLDKIKTHHCHVMACSAVSQTGKDLLAGIDWIVDDIASRVYIEF